MANSDDYPTQAANTFSSNWDDEYMDVYQTQAGNTFPSSYTDFDQYFLSYPLSHISKTNHETGNKIIMPASALNRLASLSVTYPMLFRIENTSAGVHSHCGVVEFTADEGFIFMPTRMMNNMQLQQGELVNIKNTSLPKGEYIKIQPHATKFITLSDHKSLLEKAFRDYVCLTTGDTIVVNHGGEEYVIDIVETKPSPAILLFETDCVVDFAQPLDYKEPDKKTTTKDVEDQTSNKDSEVLFPGVGTRLGGRVMKKSKKTESTTVVDHGKLVKKHEMEFKPFTGVARRVDGQPLAVAMAGDQSNVQVDENINEVEFKAFTGKSYWLL